MDKDLIKKNGSKAVRVSFLSPEQAEGPVEARKRKGRLILFVILGVVLPVMVGGFFIFQEQMRQREMSAIDKKMEVLDNFLQTNSAAVDQVNQIAQAIIAVKPLLQNRFLFTDFFSSLEDNTLPEVSYNSIAVDAKGVNLMGKAPDYRTVARQLIAFRLMPAVQDLKVSSLSAKPEPQGSGAQEVSFTVFLNLKK